MQKRLKCSRQREWSMVCYLAAECTVSNVCCKYGKSGHQEKQRLVEIDNGASINCAENNRKLNFNHQNVKLVIIGNICPYYVNICKMLKNRKSKFLDSNVKAIINSKNNSDSHKGKFYYVHLNI